MENATEALREWTADRFGDGLDAPKTRSLEVLREDPEVAVEFGEAIIALVPLLVDSGRAVKANLSIDAALLEAIDEAAKARGLTRSAFVASAAREKITQYR